jgi:hypothetical protein
MGEGVLELDLAAGGQRHPAADRSPVPRAHTPRALGPARPRSAGYRWRRS